MEKWGRVFEYDSPSDTSATKVIDFADDAYFFHDHGCLGLAVDPEFPSRPYIYVLYSLRGAPGGRLVRVTVDPSTNQMIGSPLVLIENWTEIYPSHSVGDLEFGPEGALYVSAGDGANYDFVDYGQTEPVNPDNSLLGPITGNDPPFEGGALRVQDLRTPGDPLGFNGTVLRINPDTGAAWPDNPLIGGTAADDRIIAYGLRNPFRFAIHPTLKSLWVCDVGWNNWEELNRIPFPFTNPIPNFGWPAYEGVNPQPAYQAANLPLLQSLYAEGTATPPIYAYQHTGSASATGAAFYMGGNYPPQYHGALFIGDYAQGWIKVMFPDATGTPDPSTLQTFIPAGTNVVDIQAGANGDIFYVDLENGLVRRIQFLQGNNSPNAVITPSGTSGAAPLHIVFDGSASSDPDPGDSIAYSWDLDGDGVFGDATTAVAQYTYTLPGNYTVKLRVTDASGAFDTKGVTISVDNLPPVPEILTPAAGSTWKAGDLISFSGHATDPEAGGLPASQLSWQVVLHHCYDAQFADCHEHPVLSASGVASGQFLAIDHEFPCYVEIRLTATEPGPNGLSVTTSRDLEPLTTTLTMQTNPAGLQVGAFAQVAASPLVRTVVVNGDTVITAPSSQTIGAQEYVFSGWSDGGAQSHGVHFTSSPMSFTANFEPVAGGTNSPPVLDPLWEQSVTAGNGIGFYITATDPDGPAPTLSATNMPDGAQLIRQPDGSAYFEWYTQSADAGDRHITITATDGGAPPLGVSGDLLIHVLSGNVPPSMDGVWDMQANAGDSINLRIGAWDTDGDVPDLFSENLPPGSAYADDGWGTGFFTWATTMADVGVYTGIRIYAVDHGVPPLTSERVFTIALTGPAGVPIIEPIPSAIVVAGSTVTIDVASHDPDGTVPVLSSRNLPQGATFQTAGDGTGVFTWPTAVEDAGNHSGITIIATDSATASLTYKAVFNLKVVSSTVGPVLDPIGPKAAAEGVQLQFDVTASDPDGGPPALSVIELPLGSTFIDNGNGTGSFSWTPAVGDAENSPYLVTFVASDAGATDSEIVEIAVEHPNGPPHLETIGDQSGTEGVPIVIHVHAHDHDGTVPTLAADGLPQGATFITDNGGGGDFSWVPPAGSAANSPYGVTFYASDGELTVSETISITVEPVANEKPVLAAFGPFTISEGQAWSTGVSASDPDGTVPALTAPALPPGTSFVDNGDGTGTLAWTPDYNAAAASPYTVTLVASDGSLFDSMDSTVTVTNVNRAPVMATVGNKTAAAGQLLQINVSATDPDGTALILTAQSLPGGAAFVDNGNGTGTLSWTPSDGALSGSPFTVSFTASDGVLSDSEPSVITVTAGTNHPPDVASIWNREVTAGNGIGFYITAIDPEGDTLIYSSPNLPQGARIIDSAESSSAYFEWFPATEQAGEYTITIMATDSGAPPLSGSDTFTLRVLDGNVAPNMDAVFDQTITAGEFVNLRIGAWDTDGDEPALSATNVPPGASYTSDGHGTGFLTWQTAIANVGVYQGITITATDHGNPPLSSQRVFVITVLSP